MPETVAALFAIAKLGAVFLPIFSGYGADAVAVRLERRRRGRAGHRRRLHAAGQARDDEGDGRRRGRGGAERAHRRRRAATRARRCCRCTTGRDVTLDDLAPTGRPFAARSVDSEHPLFVAYTSGTTGRPKGAVHVHAGFLVKIAEEVAFQTDLRPGERLFWLTDIGWIMGPWEIVGTLADGRHAGDVRRRARLSRARSAVGVRRASPRQRARRLADADPRADGARRRAGAARTTCRRCGSSRRPASRGTKVRGAGTSTSSAAVGARS